MPALNPQALVDYHMHTRQCPDGHDSAEEMALAAVRMGLTEMGISEHLDTSPHDEGYGCYDDAAVEAALARARAATDGRLVIRKGVEVCYQPALEGAARQALARASHVDYVIGSVHYLDSQYPPPEAFLEPERDATYRRYILDCLRLVESGLCDILGHFEYLRRHDGQAGLSYAPERYRDEVETVLRAVVERGVVLELNTSGLRRPGEHWYPCRWTLERYRALGGEAVTLGSDAHRAADVAAGIGRALALLQELGFRYVVTFQKRRRRWVAIDRFGP
ncbi:MAG: histidinol-phosphatase HisJ family protein [Anaerolineae bacterium]